MELQRITTEYDKAEDRIRLTGETDKGTTVVLWHTRRLLDRLIPHLTLWLEHQHADLPRADLIQEFAQQTAQSQFVPQAPVTAPGREGLLVQAIDLTPGAEQLHLSFKTGEGQPVGLSLAALPLRQWLTILHQAYGTAEWPTTVWPAWMTEARQSSTPTPTTMWH
ncbi:MAG: hypothetical protein Q8J72_11170 [Rhodocyclaceae bacterium]|jgi:hypothetical protein|nr:hypothetical protein [Rhodocyclaceae bacterium]